MKFRTPSFRNLINTHHLSRFRRDENLRQGYQSVDKPEKFQDISTVEGKKETKELKSQEPKESKEDTY